MAASESILAVPEVTPSERSHVLRDASEPGRGQVIYWLQQAQRERDNPALEHALALAARWERPLEVVFGLDPDYPGGTLRAFVFMLEGLRDVRERLRERGIAFTCRLGKPDETALRASEGAAALVCDRGYLRHQRVWRERVGREAGCGVVEIEGEVVVPVAVASDKLEYAARTLRPKLRRELERFASLPPRVSVKKPTNGGARSGAGGRSDGGLPDGGLSDGDLSESGQEDVTDQLDDPLALARRLRVDERAGPVSDWFRGGQDAAAEALERFIRGGLSEYDRLRNQPQFDAVSYLGMYLHFGQVSPLRVLREVRRSAEGAGAPNEAVASFVEELVVRRELAVNHAWYQRDYDSYDALPEWARRTLDEHAGDEREHDYGAAALEAGETHDRYWNAAMRELRETGYMHNYMRMYWGKRILAWSAEPRAGFELTRTLNDRYFLDGRDPNSYANVAWVYGRHDRPWPERPVFGKVRSMVAAGLERKGDPDAYVAKVERRVSSRSLEVHAGDAAP